jgi:hypothetical protein
MSSNAQMSPVVFLTSQYKIKGNIGRMAGVRLTDYMNETKDFIAVAQADVFDRASGEKFFSGLLVNVQRCNIEVVIIEE